MGSRDQHCGLQRSWSPSKIDTSIPAGPVIASDEEFRNSSGNRRQTRRYNHRAQGVRWMKRRQEPDARLELDLTAAMLILLALAFGALIFTEIWR